MHGKKYADKHVDAITGQRTIWFFGWHFCNQIFWPWFLNKKLSGQHLDWKKYILAYMLLIKKKQVRNIFFLLCILILWKKIWPALTPPQKRSNAPCLNPLSLQKSYSICNHSNMTFYGFIIIYNYFSKKLENFIS